MKLKQVRNDLSRAVFSRPFEFHAKTITGEKLQKAAATTTTAATAVLVWLKAEHRQKPALRANRSSITTAL